MNLDAILQLQRDQANWFLSQIHSGAAAQGSPDDAPPDSKGATPSRQKRTTVESASSRKQFASSLQSKLSSVLLSPDPIKLTTDRINSFDMNDLPHMNNMRYLLLFFCFVSFFVAPTVYMPLGDIQSAFYQKCFLYTEIKIMNSKGLEDSSVNNNTFFPTFDTMNTVWGPQIYCDFTTYVPVSIAIFSVIIGWSTFTIWPAMLAMGKGGVLMILYVVMCIFSLAAATASALLQRFGYENTCARSSSSQIGSYSVSCEELETINISELSAKSYVQDIHRSMLLAQVGAWGLVGLATAKVLVSFYTFLIIWFHFHYAPFFLEDTDSYYSDSLQSV